MYKLCKTAQSARRQRELEYGLLEALKTERYEDISISALCDRLQIPRKTFYRYFDSKDGALFGLIDHTLLDYEGFSIMSQNGGKGTVRQEMEQFFLFWQENRALLDALDNSGLSGILIERAIRFALSDEVIPRRLLPDDELMRRHVTIFSICGLLSMVLTWYHEGFQDTPASLSRAAEQLLSKPLFPDVGGFF